MYAFEKFVSGLGIPGFGFYIGQASKELKCRSLTGPEKLKVFRNINIHSLLRSVNSAECDRIQHLWSELLSLNTIFSKPASELPASELPASELLSGSMNKEQDSGGEILLMCINQIG